MILPVMPTFAFNHDGFGALSELADSDLSERAAADLLVRPLAESHINLIDWCILTTGEHNCRTRHRRGFDGVGIGRELDRRIGKVVAHFNAQPLDLLDITIKHGHAAGLRVFGNVRLNHKLNPNHLASCPGANFSDGRHTKKDFRSEEFHAYLAELFEDLLEKGVDGMSLDFERKAEFFPPDVSERERRDASVSFLRRIRRLTTKPVAVRVAYERSKGIRQGQDPFGWLAEGLVDAVIPATHNHESDALDWGFADFLEAARLSPRPCQVWPQIWPTVGKWAGVNEATRHPARAVANRCRQILADGAQGVYYFNFCCFHDDGSLFSKTDREIFRKPGGGGSP